jgi:hypothetical protein
MIGVSPFFACSKISERGLAAVDLLLDRGLALEFDHVLREFEQLLQEIDADQQALLMPVLQVL